MPIRSVSALFALLAASSIACADPSDKKPASGKPDQAPAQAPAAPEKKADKNDAKKDTPRKADAPTITLKVGDNAPALSIDNWVKGKEITGFEKGKVYVVEFWATWCPPCRESIPHLTKLQKEHEKGLTVIGVAASERPRDAAAEKRLETLKNFVEKQGDKMGYTVAFDGDRDMARGWMTAAGRNTIPTSFVVDAEGKIAWIGSPHDDEFDAKVEEQLKKAGFAPATTSTEKDKGKDRSNKGAGDKDKKTKPQG